MIPIIGVNFTQHKQKQTKVRELIKFLIGKYNNGENSSEFIATLIFMM